jgi:hypothetical protein
MTLKIMNEYIPIDSRNERLRQRTDAAAIKIFLSARKLESCSAEDNYGSIDLKKVRAVELMTARINRHQNITDEEDAQNAEAFERFKQLIDRDRPLGQKLYS